jgi:hypothetical protein
MVNSLRASSYKMVTTWMATYVVRASALALTFMAYRSSTLFDLAGTTLSLAACTFAASLLMVWCSCRSFVDDRPVGNSKRRCDEHSSKSSLSMNTRFIEPVGERTKLPKVDAY